MRCGLLLLVWFVLLLPVSASATKVRWELIDEDLGSRGSFVLDFAAIATSEIYLGGDQDYYTIPTTFIALDTVTSIGGQRAYDKLSFFSPTSGQSYRDDYGGGEYYQLTINESVMRIGTTSGPLSPSGGIFDVFVEEFLGFDEVTVTCGYYEEIYDDETGDLIGTGACQYYDQTVSYNVDQQTTFTGTLRAVEVIAPVPLPPAVLLAGSALIGLLGMRRRG